MLRKFLIFTALILLYSAGYSQVFVEGIVLDAKSGQVMPFVNIAITGQKTGTISDLNGEFHLNVPDEMYSGDLAFSSVGYSSVTYKISEITGRHIEVKLEPKDLEISEVVVTDKSEAGRKVFRKVAESYASNYLCSDFSYSGEYKSTVEKGGRSRNSVYKFSAYDSQGYNKGESSRAFESLNYKFVSVKRDFKVDDYESGVNFFDLVSSFDIMRYELNVMNPLALKDFDFKIKSETAEVYVIAFECQKPDIINTGTVNAKKYSGEITVQKNTNAVTEAVYTLEVKDFSPLALTLCGHSAKNTAKINCKVLYGKISDKYTLKSVEAVIAVTGSKDETYTITDSIVWNTVNGRTPAKISGKVFYAR